MAKPIVNVTQRETGKPLILVHDNGYASLGGGHGFIKNVNRKKKTCQKINILQAVRYQTISIFGQLHLQLLLALFTILYPRLGMLKCSHKATNN